MKKLLMILFFIPFLATTCYFEVPPATVAVSADGGVEEIEVYADYPDWVWWHGYGWIWIGDFVPPLWWVPPDWWRPPYWWHPPFWWRHKHAHWYKKWHSYWRAHPKRYLYKKRPRIKPRPPNFHPKRKPHYKHYKPRSRWSRSHYKSLKGHHSKVIHKKSISHPKNKAVKDRKTLRKTSARNRKKKRK